MVVAVVVAVVVVVVVVVIVVGLCRRKKVFDFWLLFPKKLTIPLILHKVLQVVNILAATAAGDDNKDDDDDDSDADAVAVATTRAKK